jgi:hypothetical protein
MTITTTNPQNIMETGITMSARSLQFYVIARKWASDIDFFKVEASFFQQLLEQHFIRLIEPANIERTKRISRRLKNLEAELTDTGIELDEQLRHIELMAEDVIPDDTAVLAVTQVRLEYMITNLTRLFRDCKKEVFRQIEGVLTDL